MASTDLGNLIWKITGDTTDFDSKIAKSESRVDAFAKKAGAAGTKLTLGVTVPLLALGAATVKAASDLGESLNAIDVVFGDAAETINNFGEIAAQSAGLAQAEFNQLATVTGTLLKTTGQGIDQVGLDTIELTKRAADVASVFDVDVSEALGSFNAALRGETEPARRFGVLLSESAIKAEILASGLDELTGITDEQRKVQARYNIIMQDTAQTQNDFTNTSDSLANAQRILKADLTNVAAELGENLIPIVTEVVGGVSDAVKAFGALDDETKITILRVAGVAAAIGPMLLAVTKAIKVFQALKLAGLAMTGPAGWITLAVGGILALAGVIATVRNEATVDRLAAEMERVRDAGDGSAEFIRTFSEQTGISLTRAIELAQNEGFITDEIRDQVDLLKEKNTGEEENTDTIREQAKALEWAADMIYYGLTGVYDLASAEKLVAEQIAEANEELGLTATQFLTVAKNAEGVNDAYRVAVERAIAQNEELKKQKAREAEIAQVKLDAEAEYQRLLDEEAAFLAAAAAARLIEEEKRKDAEQERIDLLNKYFDDYKEGLRIAQDRETAGLSDQIGLVEEKISTTERYLNQLIKAGVNTEFLSIPLSNLQALIDGLAELTGEVPQVIDETRQSIEAITTEMEELSLIPIEGLTTGYSNFNDQLETVETTVSRLNGLFADATLATKAETKSIDIGALSIDNMIFSADALTGGLSELDLGLGASAVDMALLGIATSETTEELEEQADTIEALKLNYKDMAAAGLGAAASGLDTLNASLFKSQGAYASYGDAVTASIAQVIDAIGNQIIGQAIALALLGPTNWPLALAAGAAGIALKLGAAALGASVTDAPRVGDLIGTPEEPEDDIDNSIQEGATGTEDSTATTQAPVIYNVIQIDKEPIFKVVTEGIADGQVRTVSSAEIPNPKAFLYDQYLSSFWLATGNTAEYVIIDAGVGNTISVNTVGIAGHNFTSGATIKIQGNATDSWGAPSFDETITYRAETIMHFTASTQAYRFFRLSLADAGNSDNLEIGYLFFGTYLQMPGFRPNVQITDHYEGIKTVTRSGQIKGASNYVYRTATVNFVDMSNTQRTNIRSMMNTVFTHKPVFAVIWENSMDFEAPYYGTIEGQAVRGLKTRATEFVFPMTIREAK